MTLTMYAAILAGGIGTRLWPRSRRARPKQFSDVTGSGRTMIQTTVDRLSGLVSPDAIYILTGEAYADLAAAQLPLVPRANLIAEPNGRNTLPAIGLACVHLRRCDPEAIVAILPADHVIDNVERFQAALRRAAQAAISGNLVTLGIEPTFAHTGYGYIKRGAQIEIGDPQDLPVYSVERFLEKPDYSTAEQFLMDGGYYWNGGIFIARVDRMLAEIARQAPEVYAGLETIAASLGASDAAQVVATVWQQMPSISIDYGVMEGAEAVATVPLDAGWSDMGSWDALGSIVSGDEQRNVLIKPDVVTVDSYDNIVYCDQKMVALVGVDDLVVIDTEDALLIGHRHQMQKVKDIVEALRACNRHDLL